MSQDELTTWTKCNACKKPIGFKSIYWTCSVSTCNTKRNTLKFCSVSCWDSHVPVYNHRNAWALEQTSPSREEFLKSEARDAIFAGNTSNPASAAKASSAPSASNTPSAARAAKSNLPHDILIVVSKLKDYIKQSADMNTSGDVADALSDKVRILCERAIVEARQEGRKTVMGRDFKGL